MGPSMNRITGIERLMGLVADHWEKQRMSPPLTTATMTAQ
jgi:hypothetical protein